MVTECRSPVCLHQRQLVLKHVNKAEGLALICDFKPHCFHFLLLYRKRDIFTAYIQLISGECVVWRMILCKKSDRLQISYRARLRSLTSRPQFLCFSAVGGMLLRSPRLHTASRGLFGVTGMPCILGQAQTPESLQGNLSMLR